MGHTPTPDSLPLLGRGGGGGFGGVWGLARRGRGGVLYPRYIWLKMTASSR